MFSANSQIHFTDRLIRVRSSLLRWCIFRCFLFEKKIIGNKRTMLLISIVTFEFFAQKNLNHFYFSVLLALQSRPEFMWNCHGFGIGCNWCIRFYMMHISLFRIYIECKCEYECTSECHPLSPSPVFRAHPHKHKIDLHTMVNHFQILFTVYREQS